MHEDKQLLSLLFFLCEQLRLMQVSKHARNYSTSLICTSFLWQMTSTGLYKKLKDVFLLPSIRRLQQLSQNTSVRPCRLDTEYLTRRTSHLTERNKIVLLIIDEVYTAQRMEYQNGQLIGLTENGSKAKTVLTFMVQSLFSKFKDVVYLAPVDRLNTLQLNSYFESLLEQLSHFVFVQAVSVDNHVVNRTFYQQLCGGVHRTSIEHPCVAGERLFLLFDATHNMKNIFNNWVSEKELSFNVLDYQRF